MIKDDDRQGPLVGISCTAALGTDYKRRGKYHGYVGVHTATGNNKKLKKKMKLGIYVRGDLVNDDKM